MRYCSKCGNPLTDDQVFCPKCGNKEPLLSSEEKLDNPKETKTVNTTPTKISTFKLLKGFDKVAYAYNYGMLFVLLLYLVASIFLYVNRHGQDILVNVNQWIAVAVSILVFIETIFYLIIYIIKNNQANNNKTTKIKTYLAIFILLLIGTGLAIGQIFVIPHFGVSVMDFGVLLICADVYASIMKLSKE